MSRDDPYHDRKVYHFARQWRADGAVSALCYKRPRPINLRIALWTITVKAVTCPRCLKMIRERDMTIDDLILRILAQHGPCTPEELAERMPVGYRGVVGTQMSLECLELDGKVERVGEGRWQVPAAKGQVGDG